MLNLAEFRRNPDRLSDYILWTAMFKQGVISNKDGSFQVSFRYRGPDLDSATDGELVNLCEQLNGTLKRLTSGWALYAESQRIRSQDYETSTAFPDAVTRLIEEERADYFSKGDHFESVYYFTLVYLPPPERVGNLKRMFIEGADNDGETTGHEQLNYFCEEAEKIFQLFASILPEAEPLTSDETLTYLHSTVSPKRHKVRTPSKAMYLNSFLCDSPLTGGFDPKLGDHHVRVISILGYPGDTIPGIFDVLNRLNFEYRWVNRFIFLDKKEAEAETKRYTSLWYSKRETLGQMVKSYLSNTETTQFDEDALRKSDDAAAATYEINSDIAAYGYYTTCVVILDEDEKEVNRKAKLVERVINNNLDFNAVIEKFNAVDAWFGSIPGMCYSNVRKPLINTINLSHMLPISSIWAGPKRNQHLNGPVLLYTETEGNTRFRFDGHVSDLGHSLMLGPPGTGKSAHLSLWAAAFCKYRDARVYFFDNGSSSRVLTAGVGGKFYHLGSEGEGELSFQVMAGIDDENYRNWVKGWLEEFLEAQGFTVKPEHRTAIWKALTSLAQSNVHLRNITTFLALVKPDIRELGEALQPLAYGGALGKLFDAEVDTFQTSRWQVFEMDTLMTIPSAIIPTLSYIFYKIEKALDGKPTIIFLDEAWKYLKHPIFIEKIREWLKVLRKYNAQVIFATQSLTDIFESPISSVIMDSCPTKVFLPNPNALEEKMYAMYEKCGLNHEEINIIAKAKQKKEYYYKSPLGSRIYELALGKIALAYCGSSSKEDQLMVKEILSKYGLEGFNKEWLRYKQLPEVIERLQEMEAG